MHRSVRWIALIAAVAAGAVVLVAMVASPPGTGQVFRGFYVPPAVVDGQTVRWARDYAKVELPDNGWRPLQVILQLRSPDTAPSGGTRITVAVNDVPVGRLGVDREWRSYQVAVTRSGRSDGIMAIQLYTDTPGLDGRGVGVGQIRVRPILGPSRTATWAAAGAILGALWWATLFVRPNDGRIATILTHAVPSPDPRSALCALRMLLAVVSLGILVGVLGYAELGRRLFAAVTMIPGIDRAGPVLPALLAAPASLFHVALLVGILTLPGWFVLSLQPRLRPVEDGRFDALLAMPITLMLFCVVLIPLQYIGMPNVGFTVICFLAYGAIAVTLVANPRKRDEFKGFVNRNRLFFLLQILVPLCALFYLTVGLQDSGHIVDWKWAALRNLHPLPADNDLSRLASITWREHLAADSLFAGDLWRMGDRGPLLAAAHSFLFRAFDPVAETFPEYLRLGIVLNGSFAAAVFVLVRQWSSNRVAWGCAALVALNPWFFLNVYYTWPKLFGTYFALAAIAILWTETRPTLGCFVWAGVLFGLGMLAHTAHVLSFPVFYLFTAAMYVRSPTTFRYWLTAPVSLALTQVPWVAYKHLYAPDTWNLVIQHYLDGLAYFRPLSENVAKFAARHPWPEQLRAREQQIVTVFGGDLRWPFVRAWWRGAWDREILNGLYNAEFFRPLNSAGLLWFPWIGIGAVVNLAFSICRRAARASIWRGFTPFVRTPSAPFRLRPAFVSLAFAAVSLALNAFLRWGDPITHALPYVETVLIATVGLYLLRYLGLFYWMMALGAIVVRQAQYFAVSADTSPLRLPLIDVNGVLFWVCCSALIVPCFTIGEEAPAPEAVAR